MIAVREDIIPAFCVSAIITCIFLIFFWQLVPTSESKKPIPQYVKDIPIYLCGSVTTLVAMFIIIIAVMFCFGEVNKEKGCLAQNYLIMKIIKNNNSDIEYICDGATTKKDKQELDSEFNLFVEGFVVRAKQTLGGIIFIGLLIYFIPHFKKLQQKKKTAVNNSSETEIISDKTEPIKSAEQEKPEKHENIQLSEADKAELEEIRKTLKYVAELGNKKL
jgi:type IV secretory pathway VirB2 component (pilin)